MARERSPNRDKAYEIYKAHNGNIQNREIARILNISEKTISGWKAKDKWAKVNGVLQKEKRSTPKRKGGQPGNKNATGPPGNKNAETHGFFSKHLPLDTFEIIQAIQQKHPLDILWDNIQIQYAAIIRAQNIMHVKSQDDLTKVLKKESNGDTSSSEEYELQFAWDKQANFIQAQSRAMKTLSNMIKQYEELLHKNWDLATEEQKLRVEKLRLEVNTLKDDDEEIENDGFIEALEGKVEGLWEN